ncbi:hybrid sensor histidine kinase/response regulator [Rhodovibrionaceae bacterium A322]
MDDLLNEFLTETNEGLGTLDLELVKLEQNPNDPDLLSNIFRLMHTIKGTCGFLGLPRLESVAHAGENILGKVRDGDLVITADTVSIILECLDCIRDILATLEQTEQEPEGDDADLIARLNAVANGEDGGAPADAGELDMAAAMQIEEAAPAASGGADLTLVQGGDSQEAELDMAAAMAEPAEEIMTPAEAAMAAADDVEPEVVIEAPKPVVQEPKAAAPKAQGAAGEDSQNRQSAVANQSIRVNVELLENLMTMVSELVLTRNQLLQILRSHQESEFGAPLQRLNHVVSELQEGVMKTRMQPIGNAWAKLPRIIRDLSLELGKKIELVMKGAETELDRQVLELIKDPLTHMVRNSADHGLEMPEERKAVGKPELGTVHLNAFHEGGHIIIEIRDDGKGLDVERIKAKAIANGLATESELEALSEQQIQQFIFKAGFSTAEQVTAVSGRGVGMDVVRTNIEKIGGTVELNSQKGVGSTFTIKIPLTLAIVSALIVECCEERFAIPQLSVVELVRASANSEHNIERINDTPVLRLRNRLLPLIHLRDLLQLDESGGGIGTEHFIVVAQVGTYTFGIIVDRVFDTEEIVVKPVAPILRNISLFSGNTILGDGSVVMILDPNGIASETGEIAVSEGAFDEDVDQKAVYGEEQVAMLVFRSGDTSPKAVPLALVARLEEVELNSIEYSSGQAVVQYRGQLMPLVGMSGDQKLEGEGRQQVVVFADRERHMGLVVDEIVDIVEDNLDIELAGSREGFIGSAVIGGKATDIIDTGYYLTRAFPDWFESDLSGADGEGKGKRILLIDDSPFFRNLLGPLLSAAGYDVTSVEGAEEALNRCEAGEDYDVIISDIEMPGMDGYAFAEEVARRRWAETPLVALSSHASPTDIARGREVGFTDYVAKFDRNALLSSLHDTLADMRGAA